MSSFPDFVWCTLPGLIEISSGSSNRKVLSLPTLWVTYCRKGAWISPWSKMTVFAVIYGCVLIFFSLKTMYSKCTLALFETRCTFLSFFFIKCWDVYKHRLFHGRVGRCVGSVLDLTSQTTLYACLQGLDVMQINLWRQIGNRPIPVLRQMVVVILLKKTFEQLQGCIWPQK